MVMGGYCLEVFGEQKPEDYLISSPFQVSATVELSVVSQVSTDPFRLDLNQFRFSRFIAFLRRAIEHAYGTTLSIPIYAHYPNPRFTESGLLEPAPFPGSTLE
jgi:hypothetical protein